MPYAKIKVNELLSNTSQTILDLTQISTSSTAINSGIVAHAANGELVTGAVSSDHSVENAILNNDFSGAYENSNITSIFFGTSPALTSISLPNVTVLYDQAFQGCTSLASINIPNITSIPNYCFSNCTSLSTLFFGKVTTFNDHSFGSTSSLTIVTPDITNYGTYTFQYGAGDYIIDVGTALATFNSKAFYGTDNMTSCILILRNSSQVVVAGSSDGMPKPFWVATKSAVLYAPSSLLASYQSATNWSYAYATESTTFTAIEGTPYEYCYADGSPIKSNQAITASTSAWYSTSVIQMPQNSTVIIDCQIAAMKSFATHQNFFYWGAAKTYIKKNSSNQQISYQVYTNDWQATVDATKPIAQLKLQPFTGTGTFTVTFTDGTITSTSRENWAARTNPLEMYLQPDMYIKRIRQINTGDVLVHNLIAITKNEQAGMLDTVTNTFYPYEGATIVEL